MNRVIAVGLRQLRGWPRFWLTVAGMLAVGVGLSYPTLALVRSGLIHERPILAPEGLPLPPPETEIVSALDLGGGAAGPGSATSPTPRDDIASIADMELSGLAVLLRGIAGASLLMLLVVSVNIGLLLITRGRQRRVEVATRAMLGSTRVRIARLLLVEQIPLLVTGLLAAACLAVLVQGALTATWPSTLSSWLRGEIDAGALGIALALPLTATAALAVLPALALDDRRLHAVTAGGTRITAGPRESLARDRLTLVGVASSVTLMVAAGLLLRSFAADPATSAAAFDPADTLTFRVSVPAAADEPGTLVETYAAMLAIVEGTPGVVATGLASEGAWLGLGTTGLVHALTDIPERPGISRPARHLSVSSYTSLGASVAEGRDLTADDGVGAAAVVLVNRTFANRFLQGRALGKTLQLGTTSFETTWFTVVGIVDDVRPRGLGNTSLPEPAVILPAAQVPPPTAEILVRYRGDPVALRAAIESSLTAAVPDASVAFTGSMEDQLRGFRSPLAWIGGLLAALAASTALLGGFGLHSLVTYHVTRRTREIGIRMALGAQPRRVVGEVVREGMRIAAKGIVLGLAGALCAGRLLQEAFGGVDLVDTAVYLSVLLATVLVCLTASYLPAVRAARIDPAIALLHE